MEERKRAMDLETQISLMRIQLKIDREMIAAIFHSFESQQQNLVLAYEEE